MVYRVFPALKNLNWGLGVVTVAMGVFTFTVRKRLKNFMKSGPRSLMVLYGIGIGASALYLLAASAVLGVSIPMGNSDWTQLVISGCAMYAQKKYYDKRKELFVN